MSDITTLEIKEVPSNVQMEAQVLSMIINNDKLIKDIVDTVKADVFYDKAHKEFYTAMLYLHYNHRVIGYETIIDRLKVSGVQEDDEIIGYLIEVGGAGLTKGSFESKVDLIVDLYQKRVMYNLFKKQLTTDISGVASSSIVKQVEGAIDGMGITSNIEIDRFEDYIDDWVTQLKDTTPVQNYKLGFKLLDDIVLLESSNLMLIGARPSVGKSAFATNIVKNFCLQGKHPLFVSLEMNKKEYMNRLIANMARVEARKMKRKEDLSSDEWKRIMNAKEQVKKMKFNFYDKGGLKIEQLVGLCQYLKKKDELDILVIDYLQLLESNQFKGQKQNQVGYISQKLKQIAMNLDIPVIALSQLSRGSIEAGGNVREPQLSDLRDSGSLEQDANIVLMLHTKDIEQKFQDQKFIKMFVRKNRDGRLGEINYTYYGDYVNFVEKQWNNDAKDWITIEQEELKPTEPKTFFDDIDEDLLPF